MLSFYIGLNLLLVGFLLQIKIKVDIPDLNHNVQDPSHLFFPYQVLRYHTTDDIIFCQWLQVTTLFNIKLKPCYKRDQTEAEYDHICEGHEMQHTENSHSCCCLQIH